jgi:hypothetical protein
MRGIQGLILAMGLGIAGAIFNFAYLANRSRDVEKVAFVGIKEDKVVGRGEPLLEENFEAVEIPRRWAGNLGNFAVKWEARATVVGRRAWRSLEGGSLLLLSDLKTPPQELVFGQNLRPGIEERAVGVPVDPRRFVASLVQPGDIVSFVGGASQAGYPTLARENPANPEPGKGDSKTDAARSSSPADAAKGGPAITGRRPQPADAVEIVGPFKVVSVGNRLGSIDVMQAAKIAQTQETVMTVIVRLEGGRLEPPAVRLLRLIEQAQVSNRPLVYLLHPRNQKSE